MYLARMGAVALLSIGAAFGATLTLQQGLDGYTGCRDRELRNPDQNYNSKGPYTDRFWIIEY